MSIRPLPLCVAASLVLGAVPSGAQPIPLPGLAPSPTAAPTTSSGAASPDAALPALAPPPGRVGRIAGIKGPVSFHLAGATEWQVASPNLPVTTGAGFWVAPGGEAALGIADGNRMVIGPSTQLDIDLFDDQSFNTTQPQGESYLHLQLVQSAETFTVRTPRGIVTVASAGRYEIVSGDTQHPTTVTVLDGAATLTGIPTSAEVGAGQTLTIVGDGAATPFTASIGPAVQDDFLRRVLAEERPRPTRPAAAPAIIAQMTGAEALYDTGQWSDNAEYGPVWYPPAANYVPYRQGRWAYVAPWGWTWVDDAPWGFAPTHYGRWAEFGGRWGWVPGRDWQPDRRPVYAPALVGFLGAALLGSARGPSVGWAPLGPRDTYRPPYAVNERIVQVLNQPTGANVQIVNAPVTINRNALTIVPTRVLINSAPVADAFRSGPESFGRAASAQAQAQALASPAAAYQFRPQVVPTRATIGATQAVLRQVNPAGLAAPAAHVGPGPALYRGDRPGAAFARNPGGPGPNPGVDRPSVPPGAILGNTAAGAAAGGLLRQPGPGPGPGFGNAARGALPDLRSRGPGGVDQPGQPDRRFERQPSPGAIARPLPPAAPAVAAPGAVPSPNRPAPTQLQGRPDRGAPEQARPDPNGRPPEDRRPGFRDGPPQGRPERGPDRGGPERGGPERGVDPGFERREQAPARAEPQFQRQQQRPPEARQNEARPEGAPRPQGGGGFNQPGPQRAERPAPGPQRQGPPPQAERGPPQGEHREGPRERP